MNRALKYIHDHIGEKLSVADLAGRFGYSKWYFCTRFREYTGRTFVEYVRHYRIQLAAQDILAGKKVMDVAVACGYDTPGGFNKAFLKEFGCLPAEYRRQVRESQLYYEKRRISMFQLSDRCSILREEAVNRKEYHRYYDVQALTYALLGQAEAFKEGANFSEAVAAGIVRTIDSFTPFIAPGELVVGFNYAGMEWIDYSNREAADRMISSMPDNGISEEDIAAFRELIAMDGRWRTDGNRHLINAPVKEPRTEAEEQALAEWAAIGRHIGGNHSVIGHEKVLKLGFEGLLKEVEAWEAKNGDCELYRSAKRICRAACQMGEKYAKKAEELLASGDENYRAEDLRKIIDVCRNVPKKPAASFLEAVQAFWFSHILNVWEDGINANSLGRLDQIFYPYYKADIEKGVLTKEEAFEILCCLWIKLYR
ncbi:MAG: helix-turn-helix domain-containing protein, partial [Clostridia bacterium]|nr:helix-turn-helix domain-containing protein [Clostridia bacterium]